MKDKNKKISRLRKIASEIISEKNRNSEILNELEKEQSEIIIDFIKEIEKKKIEQIKKSL